MSMNLHVVASMDGTLANGDKIKDFKEFDLWQTPTSVTYEVLAQEDRFAAYCKWVDKISSRNYNYEETEHKKALEEWLSYWKRKGYEIDWYDM